MEYSAVINEGDKQCALMRPENDPAGNALNDAGNESMACPDISAPAYGNVKLISAGLLAYLGYLTLAEYVTAYVDPQTGLLLHAFLLLVLVFASALLYSDKLLSVFTMSLIVTPLIRIMSSSMPVNLLNQQLLWFTLINFPLLVMVFLLAGYQGLTRQDIGLVFISPDLKYRKKEGAPAAPAGAEEVWSDAELKEYDQGVTELTKHADRRNAYLLQFAVMFTGPVFGVTEYYILRPNPVIDSLSFVALLSSFITFTIFTGLIEEVVFRGIIQRNAAKVVGAFPAILFTTFLFAIMHMGWKSWADIVFVFSVGFFYGVFYNKTRSLFGITISHGVTNTVLFSIAPFFLK
jgi:uncharacterized protein